jgi:hypothetical protein
VSAYEARGRNLAIKVALQAKFRAGTHPPLPAFQVARTRAGPNAAEFMGYISMKKPGRNPALAKADTGRLRAWMDHAIGVTVMVL